MSTWFTNAKEGLAVISELEFLPEDVRQNEEFVKHLLAQLTLLVRDLDAKAFCIVDSEETVGLTMDGHYTVPKTVVMTVFEEYKRQ